MRVKAQRKNLWSRKHNAIRQVPTDKALEVNVIGFIEGKRGCQVDVQS